MKGIFLVCIVCICISACQPDSTPPPANIPVFTAETLSLSNEPEINTASWQTYTNRKYNFSLEYPNGWWIAENTGKPGAPVINIYSVESEGPFDLPLTINEDPRISHISFFPMGPATDGASGTSVSLNEVNAPITFYPDSIESKAYQLNDGQLWGYYLKPEVLPENWSKEGYVFVQIGVKDMKVRCFDKEGKEKPSINCNTDVGDRIIRYGEVSETNRILIQHILSTLYFADSKENRRPVLELIKMENLSPNDTIFSPATVKGEARGMWFFEGRFNVILKDRNHRIISRSTAVATEEWHTTGMVPFETQISFNPRYSGQGYMIFQKSNPSGEAVNDRAYLLPIILGEEKYYQ